MARKSVKEKRSREIIDAFERCLFRWGMDGLSLDRIANETDIKRPALRHFIGNRDDLIIALANSLFNEYDLAEKTMTDILHKSKRGVDDMLKLLLLQSDLTTSKRIVVLMNLYVMAPSHPELKKILHKWYNNYIKWVGSRLSEFYPDADKDAVKVAATGLIGIAFNYACLSPLNLGDTYLDQAMEASRLLISTLE